VPCIISQLKNPLKGAFEKRQKKTLRGPFAHGPRSGFFRGRMYNQQLLSGEMNMNVFLDVFGRVSYECARRECTRRDSTRVLLVCPSKRIVFAFFFLYVIYIPPTTRVWLQFIQRQQQQQQQQQLCFSGALMSCPLPLTVHVCSH